MGRVSRNHYTAVDVTNAMIKKDVISSSMLFNNLPAEQLDAILAIGKEKHFDKGEVIFFEGDPGHGFFVVISGQVKIFKVSDIGKEQILHIFGPGDIFGEVPVFYGNPFPASAKSLLATTVMFFPRDAFVELLEGNCAIALAMLGVLARRLRIFTEQIEYLSLKEVPARLAGYLLYLQKTQKNHDVVELEISKGHLASLLGTSPETLSRIFKKMTEEKLISVQGRTIILLDKTGLEKQ